MIVALRGISFLIGAPTRLALIRNHWHGDRWRSALWPGVFARAKTFGGRRYFLFDLGCRLRAQSAAA
jgi:hypothetical protein